jgi:hypothetical protein
MKRNFDIGHANARSFVLGEMTSSKATRCTDNKDYVGRTVHVPSQIRIDANARLMSSKDRQACDYVCTKYGGFKI